MPQELLRYPPVYCLVGIYRLATQPGLRGPIWDKCRHGVRRGAVVGAFWTVFTFNAQRAFVAFFLLNSPRVTALAQNSFFGYKVPLATYATVMFLSSQFTYILQFFLSRNLKIARERAWAQTVKSRGKSDDFWVPYVEEWEVPPRVDIERPRWEKWIGPWAVRLLFRRVVLLPFNFVPFLGLAFSAALKGISTARYLHKPYFEAKKMTPVQVAVFMEERKWDYRMFGFVAALLESIPIVGLALTISNRIGACMWAYDLEKRQHRFLAGELKPANPSRLVSEPSSIEMKDFRKASK